jgi:hypothetical protein
MKCRYCARFFARFRCNKPLECDCPPCQGYCECHKAARAHVWIGVLSADRNEPKPGDEWLPCIVMSKNSAGQLYVAPVEGGGWTPLWVAERRVRLEEGAEA